MKKISIIMIASLLSFSLWGCEFSTKAVTSENKISTTQSDNSNQDTETDSSSIIVPTSEWSSETATLITLNETSYEVEGEGTSVEGSVLTITQPGTYVISGTLTDGQIKVDAQADGQVQIVLNGANITCLTSAPIYIVSALTTVVTVEKGTKNTLTDTNNYIFDTQEEEPSATLFSKDDLVINGEGTLSIYGNYNHGIASNDSLTIAEVNLVLTAVTDGLNANEDIHFISGNVTITAGDDGIHSDATLTIEDGMIQIIESQEGIEGSVIVVNNGEITLTAADDGVNAASDDTTVSHDITINGGTLTVDALGDGLDANGSIAMNGGVVTVAGPTNDGNGAVDYDGTLTVNGGTLIAYGSSGMAQNISDTSTQCGLMVVFDQMQEAGTSFEVIDEKGNVIVTITPNKNYQEVLVSSENLSLNSTYQIHTNGKSLTNVTLSNIVTSISQDGTAVTIGMMNGGGMQGGMGGEMDGERPELPEGTVKGEEMFGSKETSTTSTATDITNNTMGE